MRRTNSSGIAERAALDPLLDAVAVGQTWHEAEEARLAARRWGRAVEVLRARLTDVREAEREVCASNASPLPWPSATPSRPSCATKYPALAAEIASLLARLEEADRPSRRQPRPPQGREPPCHGRMLARGVPGNFLIGANRVTPLALAVRLPGP